MTRLENSYFTSGVLLHISRVGKCRYRVPMSWSQWLNKHAERKLSISNDRTAVLAMFTGTIRYRGYKIVFMLNSVKHEILNTHKSKNIKKFGCFRLR